MAKPTWRNLPEDKRARIAEVAMQEFGARGFATGSLNVIAEEAGIAKGSLFQYFDDKLDLYLTICQLGAAEVEAHVLELVDLEAPLFDSLRAVVAGWMIYFRERPVRRRIFFAATHEVDPAIRAQVRGMANARYQAAFGPLVHAARQRGQLRDGVDDRLVLSLVTVVLRHLNSAPFDPAGDPAIPFLELSDAEVERWALAYVDALEAAFAA